MTVKEAREKYKKECEGKTDEEIQNHINSASIFADVLLDQLEKKFGMSIYSPKNKKAMDEAFKRLKSKQVSGGS